jgi:hypothetical protein
MNERRAVEAVAAMQDFEGLLCLARILADKIETKRREDNIPLLIGENVRTCIEVLTGKVVKTGHDDQLIKLFCAFKDEAIKEDKNG